MKKLFCFAIWLSLVCSVMAKNGTNFTNVPIIGALGLRLGDVLTEELADQIYAHNPVKENGCIKYEITPTKKFANYETYYVIIATKSRKIAKIVAELSDDTEKDRDSLVYFRRKDELLDNPLRGSDLFLFTKQEISKKYKMSVFFDVQRTAKGEFCSAIIEDENDKSKYIYISFDGKNLSLFFCDYKIYKSEAIPKKEENNSNDAL